jgi:hypothetical protein
VRCGQRLQWGKEHRQLIWVLEKLARGGTLDLDLEKKKGFVRKG